eukprot:scaffold525953_cov34-Prasinocladus_malaysianus.AAC.1
MSSRPASGLKVTVAEAPSAHIGVVWPARYNAADRKVRTTTVQATGGGTLAGPLAMLDTCKAAGTLRRSTSGVSME